MPIQWGTGIIREGHSRSAVSWQKLLAGSGMQRDVYSPQYLSTFMRALLLVLLPVVAIGQETVTPVWSHTFPELTTAARPVPSAVALASNGRCAAIAGAGVATV